MDGLNHLYKLSSRRPGLIWNDLIYLLHSLYFPQWSHQRLHSDSSEAINEKTISSNKVRSLFLKSSEKTGYRTELFVESGSSASSTGLKSWMSVFQWLLLVIIDPLTQHRCEGHTLMHKHTETICVPSALCFILLKNKRVLCSHQLQRLLKGRTVTCFT